MYEDITLIFDVDGTLCPIKKKEEQYIDLIPDEQIVEKLKYYKENGAKIVLFSSRNMNSYHGNLGLINANTAVIMQEWLKKWNIPYDEILFGKMPIKKKRIAIRKLSNIGIEKKFIQLFLKLLEYVEQM